MKPLTEEQMKEILWDMVAANGSRSAVADILGVTPSYMSDILNGNRAISDSVARKIGFYRETVFKPLAGDN